MTTVPQNLKPAMVTLADLPPVAAFVDPSEQWNGFACPYFTGAQIPALLVLLAQANGRVKAHYVEEGPLHIENEGEIETFKPIQFEGDQLWHLAGWSWHLSGFLTDVECPGCGQRIFRRDEGSTECGWQDQGTCMDANYAHDKARGMDPEWEADDAPPDAGECDSILAAHRMVSDGELA